MDCVESAICDRRIDATELEEGRRDETVLGLALIERQLRTQRRREESL